MTPDPDDDTEIFELTPEQMRHYETFHGGRTPKLIALLRTIMNQIGVWRHCPHNACKRAKACASPKAECATRFKPALDRYVFPALRRHIETRRASLPAAPDSERDARQGPPLRGPRTML